MENQSLTKYNDIFIQKETTNPFIIASRKIKHYRTNPTKEVKDPDNEHFKILKKGNKEIIRRPPMCMG